MSDELKLTPDVEDQDIDVMTENVDSPIVADSAPADAVDSVTEADVIAAFNEAEKSLGMESVGDATPAEEISPEQEEEIDAVAVDRNQLVTQFQMDWNLDDIPDADGMGNDETPEMTEETPEETIVESIADTETPEEKTDIETVKSSSSKSRGCLLRLVFALLILLISVALATVITTAVFDVTGFNRNNKEADVYIPKGADTEKVASILKEEGMINSETYFCWYVRLMKLDDKWREGSFSLQADMGFPTLINTMQAKPPRKTVKVTFPEGLTVPEMADILEENKVCSAESFINAVRYGDFDYDFVRDIPSEADDPEYAHRAYRLEGYLFPDTYEFYEGSLGETVVDRMLQNFESKISKSMLAQIKNNGWTLDQAVIFASMVQGEGDTRENMDKISRVLHNRLEPNSGFKVLQLCSTRDYVNYLLDLELDSYDAEALKNAYNTYYREGFPIGAICNPGLDAFNAVLYPSVDPEAMKYYFFATDYKTGITYFSKTAKEHANIIKKYGIEDIG